MRYRCVQSIQVPLGVGRFSAFEAGREYSDRDIPPGARGRDALPAPEYFEPVNPSPARGEGGGEGAKSQKGKKEVTGDGN